VIDSKGEHEPEGATMPVLIAIAFLALAAIVSATIMHWKTMDAAVEFATSPAGIALAVGVAVAIVWAVVARRKQAP